MSEDNTKSWTEAKKPVYEEEPRLPTEPAYVKEYEYEEETQKYFTKLRFRERTEEGENLILEIKTRTYAEGKDQACKIAETYARKLLTEKDWKKLTFHAVEAREETA